jgi:hypothetical protein
MSTEKMIASGLCVEHERFLAGLAKWLAVGLLLAPLSSVSAQPPEQPPGQAPADSQSAALPEACADALKFGGSELAVVFAVDRDGNTKAYYNGKATPGHKTQFPKKKNEIANVTNISVFQTTNPTTCWLDGLGYQRCVSW